MITTIEAPVEVPAKEVATETPKPLKLSEALRLGAMMTEQTFGEIGDVRNTTCAVGAFGYGFGARTAIQAEQIVAELDRMGAVAASNCDCYRAAVGLVNVIGHCIHLNDAHHWPREKIADWLASIGL